MMMELVAVSRYFGAARAVDMLDLKIQQGQIIGLIGSNGSGKSTIINMMSGMLPLSAGRMYFNGRDMHRVAVHKRVACGLARTFQNGRLFGQLSVWQNLLAMKNGVARHGQRHIVARCLGGFVRDDAEMLHALALAGLLHKKDALAATLSCGEQRDLELARALATRPRLLLLDEPAAGMDMQEIDQLRQRILDLRRNGLTIVLVEHVMALIMNVADRIAVLDCGRKIAEGTPSEIRKNQVVRKAYLGDEGSW